MSWIWFSRTWITDFFNDLLFLPDKIKVGKFENIAANLFDKTEYVTHGLEFQSWISSGKVYRVIKFNQNTWKKRYTNTNTDMTEKDFGE